MASNLQFVEYVCDQIRGAGEITHCKMFGEYGLHFNGKYIACICENQLLVKPTAAGKEFLRNYTLAPPYEGGSDYILITNLDDKESLQRLFLLTWEELPLPKPKKPKAPRKKAGG